MNSASSACGFGVTKAARQQALIRSQNPHLRQLDEALQSEVGLAALRAGYDLKRSVDVTRGDTALFREALLNAKQALQEARGKVVTGFAGEADLGRDIQEIIDLAEALYEDMSSSNRRAETTPTSVRLKAKRLDDEPTSPRGYC